ncbi:MAG TPA: hypothetical protein VJA65_08985 [bacterium]|nr:hypothetical protein [bacterium]
MDTTRRPTRRPDEPRPGVDDAVIEAAVRWLTIQPSCARAMASIP